MIPLHPQRVPDHPDRLRWIVPPGLLTVTGPLAGVPAPLAALLDDGTLAEVTAEPTAVVTRLGEGRSWSGDGARVRTALHNALADPTGWAPADRPDRPGDDDLLAAAARDLLAGPVGAFARSHGGSIELLGVRDGVVTVRLGGACHGCAAAWLTLHWRLERELRRRHPGLRELRNAAPRTAVGHAFRARRAGRIPHDRTKSEQTGPGPSEEPLPPGTHRDT
ncbi:NifU family protein [Streptomyces sp. NRRL F-4489]|uniref:NifU family protein n=1 Tax=Streptomyces sp. NRRL F-4489 TaxID=1609095 RepID=UPI000832F19A|nr:NifU family protein [Streptomyces sp. NRRL F-4489]